MSLVRLAAALGPLRWVLASIAERFVSSQAHRGLCFARLGDYAREGPGLSARQLHELARVKRAFERLPCLERALLDNELPWTKLRLLVRVATPGDERDWIARGRGLRCRELEQVVKACTRSPDTAEDGEPRRRVALRCSPSLRAKWAGAREFAERVAGERLSDADALEWILAEAFSGSAVEPALPPPRAPKRAALRRPGSDPQPAPRAGASGLLERARDLLLGLDGADARELDRRLRAAVRLEQGLDAALAPLLRVVASGEYAWRREYQTLAGFAREQLGMSPSKARALLRLERVGDVCPELRTAYRGGRLSWSNAQCLAPLLGIDVAGAWRPIWVAWAQRVTLRRLAGDVERALLLRAGTRDAWQRCKFDPARAQDPVPAGERQMCAREVLAEASASRSVDPEATETLSWSLPESLAALFQALRAKLGFEGLLDHACEAWSLRDPAARRPDPVFERDGYRCAAPGCSSRRNLHDHHVVFRSAGGSNALENRITLCAFHHQRGVHAGRMRVSGRAPDGLCFEMPFGVYRSGDIQTSSSLGPWAPITRACSMSAVLEGPDMKHA